MAYLAQATDTPFLSSAGPIAAIIICFYAVLLIILILALGIVSVLLFRWVNKQADLIKLLRPTVDTVNKTTEAIQRGVPASENENQIIRTIAQGPERLKTIDHQVDELSDRVVGYAIEFRARTLQVQTIAQAFFLPGLKQPDVAKVAENLTSNPPTTSEAVKEQMPKFPLTPLPKTNGREPAASAIQRSNVSSR